MFLGIAFLTDPLVLFVTGLVLLGLLFGYLATEFERRKRNVGSILILGVTALCALAVYPPSETLKKGIDIGGGSSFTLKVQPNKDDSGNPLPVTVEAAAQAEKTIRKRLDEAGTKEPYIARQGNDRILVQMPGVSDEESKEIRQILEKAAKLELKEVNPQGSTPGTGGKTLAQRVADKSERVPGFLAYEYKRKNSKGEAERSETLLLNRRTALTGKDIVNAFPDYARPGYVNIRLSGAGEDKMINLTKNMVVDRDRIAIVLDGEVLSAPVVQHTPLGRDFVISGLEDVKEAQTLSSALMNPLENSLVIEEFRMVSPTLGQAVVKQGVWAGVVGISLTFVFLLLYYRLGGVVALIGLLLHALFLLGCMAMFRCTLTLPGIAGMILTIGMGVDANVLIYERLREEMAAGKSLASAISASYAKAFSAIFDGNVTSLITAAILFWRASGTVKGFAVTLSIGLLTSLFAAILVTRVLFWWGLDLKVLRKLSFLNLVRGAHYDFMGKAPIAIMLSIITFIVTVGAFAWKGKAALGIDFTGGTRISCLLGEKQVSEAEINRSIANLTLSKLPFVQSEKSPISGLLMTVRCATPDAQKVIDQLRKDIPVLAEKSPEPDKKTGKPAYVVQMDPEEVSPTLGSEFFVSSLWALGLGLAGIFIYIAFRYEASFAVGGIVSLFHDVLITTGAVVLFGGELSLIHVGAILTLAGYSINDTIVVFDRIRDNLQHKPGEVKKLMNEAINATLSRTILTSFTTMICVVVLALFGGAALKDFAEMILIGIVLGTFSSIFVASPIVLWWSNFRGSKLHREAIAADHLGTSITPAR